MKQLELTPRLDRIARLVPEGARIADIGTDHAYLPVFLLLQGRIQSAIAADINKGPLERARATAAAYDCTEHISFLLCDGLAQVRAEDADTIIIAGMGGETIAAILQAASWLKQGHHVLILQPMSAQEELRGWLWRNGFDLTQEDLVAEGDKLYIIFCVSYGGARPMTIGEEWAGRQSADLKQPLRSRYLDRLVQKLERAMEGIRKGSGTENSARMAELTQVHHAICQMKKEWDEWQR